MNSHRGKSVKTLIDERLSGKQYIRVSARASSATALPVKRSINVVLQSFLDSKIGPREIIKPVVQAPQILRPQAPSNVKYRSPTLLQKLNPISNRLKEEGMLDQALEEVSSIQTEVDLNLSTLSPSPAKDLVPSAVPSATLHNASSVASESSSHAVFTRTPRSIAALMR